MDEMTRRDELLGSANESSNTDFVVSDNFHSELYSFYSILKKYFFATVWVLSENFRKLAASTCTSVNFH